MAFLILAKVFGWHPLFKTDNRIKGVSFDYSKDIKYDKFSGESISFVMLKAGSGETAEEKLKDNYKAAKDNKIDVGLFWIINAGTLNEVPNQIKKAKEFIKKYIKEEKNEIKYKFYFKINTPNAFDHLTEINNFCDNELDGYCGLSVGVSTFNSKLKDHMSTIDKITHIWIDSYDKDFDIKVNEKILIHNLNEEVTLGSTFTIIEAKKS